MKLSAHLLQAVAIGVAVSSVHSFKQNEVNSGRVKQVKTEKGKKVKPVRDNCPACGRG